MRARLGGREQRQRRGTAHRQGGGRADELELELEGLGVETSLEAVEAREEGDKRHLVGAVREEVVRVGEVDLDVASLAGSEGRVGLDGRREVALVDAALVDGSASRVDVHQTEHVGAGALERREPSQERERLRAGVQHGDASRERLTGHDLGLIDTNADLKRGGSHSYQERQERQTSDREHGGGGGEMREGQRRGAMKRTGERERREEKSREDSVRNAIVRLLWALIVILSHASQDSCRSVLASFSLSFSPRCVLIPLPPPLLPYAPPARRPPYCPGLRLVGRCSSASSRARSHAC